MIIAERCRGVEEDSGKVGMVWIEDETPFVGDDSAVRS